MRLRETSAAVHTPTFAANRMDFESTRFRVAPWLALALFPLISAEPIFQATALANAQMVAQRATHGHPTIQPSHLFLVPTGLDQAVFLEQDHRHNSNQVVAAGADASATRVHTAEGIGECLPKTFIMRQV